MQIANSVKLIVAIIFLYSCDPADNRLKIVNDSNSDIYLFYACDSSLENFEIFRNGYYSNKRGDSTYVTSGEFVESESFINIPKRLGHKAWISYVKNCPNQSINIYFFLDSTVTKNSDAEIRDFKLFEKHVKITLKELKQNNWTVRYP